MVRAIIAMSDQQVDVKVEVSAIMPNYMRDRLEGSFRYPLPRSREADLKKIDPNYVTVQLLQGQENRVFVINMILGSDYAKKLNLTVGDKLTLKLVKENQ